MKTECDCMGCRALCLRVPGWFTPEEAQRAIEAGLAAKLKLDDWSDGLRAISVLSPGDNPKSDVFSKFVRSHYGGGCVFHDEDGLCEIHSSGFKPEECRLSFYCEPNPLKEGMREKIAKQWDTTEGRGVIYRWGKEVGAP